MLPGVGRQIQCLLCLDGLLFSSLDDSREIPTHIPSCHFLHHFLHPPNDRCPPSLWPSHPFSHAPPERVTARPGYRRRFDESQGLRMLQHITKSSWPGLPRPSSPTFPPPTSVPRPQLHRDWPATPHGLRKNSSTGVGSQATRQHLPAPRRLGGCFSAARRALGGSRGLMLRSLSGSRRPFGRYRATTQKEPRQFGAVSTVTQTPAAMIRRLFLGARCPPRRRSSTKPASPPHSQLRDVAHAKPTWTHHGKVIIDADGPSPGLVIRQTGPKDTVVRSRHGPSLQRSVSLLDDDSDASAAHHQTVHLERWLGAGGAGGQGRTILRGSGHDLQTLHHSHASESHP